MNNTEKLLGFLSQQKDKAVKVSVFCSNPYTGEAHQIGEFLFSRLTYSIGNDDENSLSVIMEDIPAGTTLLMDNITGIDVETVDDRDQFLVKALNGEFVVRELKPNPAFDKIIEMLENMQTC